MKITKNIRPTKLISWHDLTKKELQEFDWLEIGEEEKFSPNFFRSNGQVFCLDEFSRTSDGLFPDWDGFYAFSAFSGVLVKIIHDIDVEVIVGRYYS